MPGLDVRLAEEDDPVVLSPQLIITTLREDKSKDGEDTEDAAYILANTDTIRLEFKKIIKIENLNCLSGLTRLFLDNNFIEEISGLECLPHLEWLDLSFNRIRVLENLEAQTNLKVLAIFHNQIKKVENVHHMKKLEVLRLGNNRIEDRDCIIYLRKLHNLRTLSLKGNPVFELEEFHGYVAAFLPDLVYFEFKMIDNEERRIHTEKNQGEIFKVLGTEQKEEHARRQQEQADNLMKREEKAFIDNLRGEDLVRCLFSQRLDEEEEIIKIPEARDTKQKFDKDFMEIMLKLYNTGLEALGTREKEWSDIDYGIRDAKNKLEIRDVQIIKQFNEEKQEILDNLMEMGEQLLDLDPESISYVQIAEVESVREEYRKKVKVLSKNLLGHEILLINSIEGMIEEYERRLGNMTYEFLETCGEYIQEARDLETIYFQRLLELADVSGGVRTDYLLDIISLCHDEHQRLMDSRQEGLRLAVNTWREEHFKSIRDSEFNRSRSRVLEICKYIDTVCSEADNVEVLPQATLPEED